MNIYVQIFLWLYFSFVQSKYLMVGWYGRYVFKFSKNSQTVFQIGYLTIRPHQQPYLLPKPLFWSHLSLINLSQQLYCICHSSNYIGIETLKRNIKVSFRPAEKIHLYPVNLIIIMLQVGSRQLLRETSTQELKDQSGIVEYFTLNLSNLPWCYP